ncbi:MAG: nucleotidyltransferase domain-containing protein [Bacteroidota bacterium]
MNSVITQQLLQLEAEKGITILYACESGSRAWGFPSPDSDYDVRIIYVHPPDWYLSIDDKKDTLELPINDELDISGWELRKALRIMRKSNAVIFEWLQSPIIYQNRAGFREELLALMPSCFSARSGINHHLGLVHNAFNEIAEQPEVKLKKYFYILRSLLSAMWVREYQTVPPMEFQPLTRLMANRSDLLQEIEALRQKKSKAVETAKIPTSATLHQFIEAEVATCERFAKILPTFTGNTEQLNHLFKKWVNS